ncbi:MAG: PAS domain S-box protein [Leptolyngbya sp. DLM2.Bin15]|nr:MAG: PAS domain S-box protein [Leptolyngbya sp. DLM2.Bin15]
MSTPVATFTAAQRQAAIACPPITITADVTVQEAIAVMSAALSQPPVEGQDRLHQDARASCLLVVEHGQLLGSLSSRDVIHLVAAHPSSLATLSIRDVITAPQWLRYSDLTDVSVAETQLQQSGNRHVWVTDDAGQAIGVMTYDTLQAALKLTPQAISVPLTQTADLQEPEYLRYNLTLLEHILDTVLAGYWDWDLVSNQEYWSRGCKGMLGYEDHELTVAESWKTIIFPDDLPVVLEAFRRHLESRGDIPFQVEVRYRHKDGSTVWIFCSGQIIEWSNPTTPRRMLGCHVDITQRKLTEQQLRKNKEELERFFSVALDLLCIADSDGKFCRVNQSWNVALGYEADELEGRSCLDFVHPDDLEITLQALADLKQQKMVRGLVNRYRCKDGSYRYLEWYAQPYDDLLYCAAHDITERQQVEEQLRKSDAHLQAAQRIAKLGSWEFDVKTEVIYWSDEVFRIFGRDPAAGMPTFDELQRLYHPEDQLHHNQTVQRGLETGQPYDLECRAYRPDGTLVYIQARGEPIFDSTGQLVQLVGTILDITDRKQAELKLQQTTAQLEASNQELEAFAYSVSHDLRSPLRAIDGFSRALLEDYGTQLDDQGRDYFDRIRRNVQRMGMLIDDLLRLSRVSRSEMRYATVNLSTLVLEQMSELQVSEPDRQVEVIVAPGVLVSADATLMRVVISNLLQNAWKFTSHHPTARIEFGTTHVNGQLTYFVQDDGAGFDMTYANMLFGVFQRLHNTHEFPGTGIGLATVQRAIHRHGGQVWAEGQVEQGATIYFTLPFTPITTGGNRS